MVGKNVARSRLLPVLSVFLFVRTLRVVVGTDGVRWWSFSDIVLIGYGLVSIGNDEVYEGWNSTFLNRLFG